MTTRRQVGGGRVWSESGGHGHLNHGSREPCLNPVQTAVPAVEGRVLGSDVDSGRGAVELVKLTAD